MLFFHFFANPSNNTYPTKVKPLRAPGRDEEIATVAEAAAELGVSERRVRTLCSEGRIVGARRVGRDWVIPRPIRVLPGERGPRATWEKD